MDKKNDKDLEIKCHRCGRDDKEHALLATRLKGENIYTCTRCLPALIHG